MNGAAPFSGRVRSVENISKKGPLNRRSLHYAPPDSLLRPVVLGIACGSLYGEPHTWALPAARSRKSGYASVEMTKGRAAPPSTVAAEQEPFFITLGGPQAHDPSVEKAP